MDQFKCIKSISYNGSSGKIQIRVVFLSVAILSMWLGDPIVSITRDEQHFVRLLIDSSFHALIGGFLWIASHPVTESCLHNSKFGVFDAVNQFTLHIRQFLFACFTSSLLDIDHFISANSWTLYGATHLGERPFGHNVLFALLSPVFVFILLRFYFSWFRRYDNGLSAYSALFVWNAVFSHQLRDALRRGLYFWPKVKSSPLSRITVSMAYTIMVVTQGTIISSVVQEASTQNIVDNKKLDVDLENRHGLNE